MKWLSVTAVALATFVMTLAKPELLGSNKFMDQLASPDLVAILVVILTVTMASVANIHLALSRLKKSFRKHNVNIDEAIFDARTELSENAWYLFYSFIVLICVLVTKGWVDSIYLVSACHAAALVILALNMAILYDTYMSVYMLTSLDEPAHPHQPGDGTEIGDGSEE